MEEKRSMIHPLFLREHAGDKGRPHEDVMALFEE